MQNNKINVGELCPLMVIKGITQNKNLIKVLESMYSDLNFIYNIHECLFYMQNAYVG